MGYTIQPRKSEWKISQFMAIAGIVLALVVGLFALWHYYVIQRAISSDNEAEIWSFGARQYIYTIGALFLMIITIVVWVYLYRYFKRIGEITLANIILAMIVTDILIQLFWSLSFVTYFVADYQLFSFITQVISCSFYLIVGLYMLSVNANKSVRIISVVLFVQLLLMILPATTEYLLSRPRVILVYGDDGLTWFERYRWVSALSQMLARIAFFGAVYYSFGKIAEEEEDDFQKSLYE